MFRVTTLASDEDYSWLRERFGLGLGFVSAESLQVVVDDLRADLIPTVAAVVETLSSHLTSRVEEIWDDLDFVVANTQIQNRADALKIAQFGAAADRGEVDPGKDLRQYQAAWSVRAVEAVALKIPAMNLAQDRLEAFAAFSEIERLIEPLETEVEGLASLVDRRIQYEIDVARGK